MVSRSRMPPPSCTGISSPTAVEDRLDRGLVLTACRRKRRSGRPGAGAARPASSQLARHRGRVFAEDGGLVHVALFQANAVTVFQIDGRNQQHGRRGMAVARRDPSGGRRQGFQCRKLRYSARPWSALFSGWNWVAKILSRATRAGKARAVVGFARAVARVGRPRVIAVHEVEVAAVGHARPERVRLRLAAPGSSPSAAPCSGCRRAAAGRRARSCTTSPAIRPRPSVGPFVAAIEQHLHADADAEQRLAGGRLQHRFLQAGIAQLAHAVGHGALPRQHDALGGAARPRVAT